MYLNVSKKTYERDTELRVIDGISTLITLGMFIYVVVQGYQTKPFNICYYKTHTIWSSGNQQDFNNIVTQYNTAIENKCENSSDRIFSLKSEWGDVSYKGTFVNVADSCYNPFSLLAVVFLFAFLFQFQRTVDFHNASSFIGYYPESGPCIVRWLEYAITSPLEIVLIASSFFISDVSLLYTLACLQGALIWLGYLIELLLEKIQHHGGVYCFIAPIVFSTAVFFHWIIWDIIFKKYFTERDSYNNCHGTSQNEENSTVPIVVTVIIWSEFIIFSLFGVVQLRQLIVFITNYHMDNEQIESEWRTSTKFYSILSIISKTILGIAFISYVQMSAGTYISSNENFLLTTETT